jgi:flagellar biogenesis protein FliO
LAQPTIEIAQILTVGGFICALLLLRAYVLKRAPQISNKLVKGRRLVHVETYPLRHQAMVSLMEVDHEKIVIVHGRNQPASILRLETMGEIPEVAEEPNVTN